MEGVLVQQSRACEAGRAAGAETAHLFRSSSGASGSVDACPCGRAAVKVLAGETDCPDASKQSGSAERVARLLQKQTRPHGQPAWLLLVNASAPAVGLIVSWTQGLDRQQAAGDPPPSAGVCWERAEPASTKRRLSCICG